MSAVSAAIESNADAYPEKLAVVQVGGGSLTYRELSAAVKRVASNLHCRLHEHPAYDLELGSDVQNPPILLLSNDSLQSITTVIAINWLGLTVAPMNSDMGIPALSKAIDAIGAGVTLHDNSNLTKAQSLQTSTCWLVNMSDLVVEANGAPPRLDKEAEYPYLLTLSSGSTGDPKPVIYTDAGKLRRARFTAAEFGFTHEDTLLCASPFFHSLGQRLTFMPLTMGATMVLLPRFSADRWLDAVQEHQVSATICVSSHLFALKDSLINGDPRAGSVRALVSSSASIDRDTKSALFDSGNFEFFEMYGASEVATATRLSSTDPVDKRSSVGSACQGVCLKIINSKGEVANTHESGEIVVKSPLCSPGYYERDDLNAAAFEEGWFRTGDLGYVDPEGFLYFVDRTSDVIISGGSNIFPSDVEACLRDHPHVSDCLVIGVKDSYLGEAVVAIVLGKPEAPRTLERSLRQHVRHSLATSQQPMLYFIVEELPLNGAGKVDRKGLRQHYNELGLDPSARFSQALMSKAGT